MEKVTNWPATWGEIAVAFDTPYYKRTEKQKYMTEWGLCYAIYKLGEVGHAWAIKKICLIAKREGFWWDCRERNSDFRKDWDYCRATFAGIMAAMTHQEFEKFLEWCGKHKRGKNLI